MLADRVSCVFKLVSDRVPATNITHANSLVATVLGGSKRSPIPLQKVRVVNHNACAIQPQKGIGSKTNRVSALARQSPTCAFDNSRLNSAAFSWYNQKLRQRIKATCTVRHGVERMQICSHLLSGRNPHTRGGSHSASQANRSSKSCSLHPSCANRCHLGDLTYCQSKWSSSTFNMLESRVSHCSYHHPTHQPQPPAPVSGTFPKRKKELHK